ncbi:hypothetical protein FDECE_8992 [Fusarium decemcellulare]|nr:hypothetical protein FDECE_8992 [Fusarium decemcellulare]
MVMDGVSVDEAARSRSTTGHGHGEFGDVMGGTLGLAPTPRNMHEPVNMEARARDDLVPLSWPSPWDPERQDWGSSAAMGHKMASAPRGYH